MSKNLYKQAMNHLKIPADMNEKTIEFLQKNKSTGNTIKIKANLSRIKRTSIIAATIIAAVFFMGAAFAIIAIRQFDLDGNSILQYIPFRKTTLPSDELRKWHGEFTDYDNSENIFYAVYGDNAMGVESINIYPDIQLGRTYPRRNISYYDELQNYLDGDVIKLPQYIPDGYEFSKATVTFFVGDNFDFSTAELIAREEKYGNIYEKYYIPENPANVQEILVEYEKIGNEGSHYIWYRVRLENPKSVDITITGAENTESEILRLPQFTRNLLLSTNQIENGEQLTQYNFTAINTIPIRRGYILLNKDLIEVQGSRAKEEYGTVFYNINADYLPREEIISIAESIK